MLTFAIKSTIVLAALYIPYTLLLRSETFVRLNRVVLLTIMALSLTLPLINVPFLAVDLGLKPSIEIGALTVVRDTPAEQSEFTELSQLAEKDNSQLSIINYQLILSLLYIIGVAITLAARTIQLIALRRRITRGCLWTQTEGGVTVFCHAEAIAPFSWFSQVVVSQQDIDECGDIILTHERAHVALHHSADMMLAMMCQALQWFNPFVWLLTDSLQEVHEYEADRHVIESGVNIKEYQLLLIKKTVGKAWPAFTNSLKSNQLKNRFKMMLQRQSSPWRRARVLYVLPIALAALSVFATNNTMTHPSTLPQPSPTGEGAGQSLLTAEEDDAVVMTETNEAPVLVLENARVDEEKGVVEFHAAHVETPANSPTRSACLGQEFSTSPSPTSTTKTDSKTQKLKISKTHTDDYLVIVDGVPQENAKLEDFNKDDIYSISVIKDEDAKKPFVEKYGAKAKTAVILITMKDDRVFDVCEELPEYPGGGQEAMFKFLAQNLSYPKGAIEQGLQGNVVMSFIVEKDGSLSNIKVLRAPGADWQAKEYEVDGVKVMGYGKNADGSIVTEQQKDAIVASLGDEAMRVLRLMPNWNPGKQRGKYVRVKFTLPITFRLS